MFRSSCGPSEVVIDDNNFQMYQCDPVVEGEPMSRGMWDIEQPYGAVPYASGVPESMLLPESEWKDRIEEQERTKTRPSDKLKRAGFRVKGQNGTSYCWVNGVTVAVEGVIIKQGQSYVPLSPAAVGAPIKNYRDQGGWGDEALRYYVEHGGVPESMWPPNAINRRYDTPETREIRSQYQVKEWWELRPRNEREMISLLLQGWYLPVGYNWWRHLVLACDALYFGPGKYGIRIANSWDINWGEDGYGVLKGTRHLADGIVCPRARTPAA